MVEVTLTWREVEWAARVGALRQIEAMRQGLEHIAGFDGLGWDIHVEGAAGELAFAKATDRYWDGSVNTFKEGGDVGAYQVRTRSRHVYDLLVRPDDSDIQAYVLVTGTVPAFQVHGWMLGADAKRPEFLQTYANRPKAYFVPKGNLYTLELLP